MNNKNISFIIATAILISSFIFNIAFANRADLPEYIREQLHSDITYTLITDRNTGMINDITKSVKPKHFIVVQAGLDKITNELASKLMGWVERGGVLWFNDSRLAPLFGMENSSLSGSSIQGKAHRGDYGSGKADGLNAIGYIYPFVEHPVATGIQNIQVFLLKIGEDEYSAVSDKTPGVIPIVRANMDPKCIVAIKKVGNGSVIFKPLVWTDVLGGERFQTNLLEFSGGYPVPKSEKPIIPSEYLQGNTKLPRYDSLILSDGQQAVGMVFDDQLQLMAADGDLNLKVNEMEQVSIEPTGTEITMKDGKKYIGSLMSLQIKFKTCSGKLLKIDKESIKSIKLNIGAGEIK